VQKAGGSTNRTVRSMAGSGKREEGRGKRMVCHPERSEGSL
jgi:hypothetical protein